MTRSTSDREAVTALRRMEELRVEAQRMIERGAIAGAGHGRGARQTAGPGPGEHDVSKRAISAQENFDKTMLRVNVTWILEGIKKGSESRIITLG